jgi:hypothetical protein
MSASIRATVFGVALALSCSAPIQAKEPWLNPFEQELYYGQTGAAAAIAADKVAAGPNDRLPRFAHGIAMFLEAIRRFGNDLYRYGLTHDFDDFGLGSRSFGLGGAPFLRIPVPPNADPEPITYAKVRQSLVDLVVALEAAERELSLGKEGDVVLTLDVSRLHLDLNGDGSVSSNETLWRILDVVALGRGQSELGYMPVDFDQSDALWLRAYCHLIAAMAEFMLGYDWELAYNDTFQGVFPAGEFVPPDVAASDSQSRERLADLLDKLGAINLPHLLSGWQGNAPSPEHREAIELSRRLEFAGIFDTVAFIHLLNWPVADAERLESSLMHLEAMVSLSRANWASIQAETDSGREWIPNLNQTGVLAGMRIDQARIDGWAKVLDELGGILQGRILVPHWRFEEGINLRRVFLEPRPFDLVMLLHGASAVPYLEAGTKTDPATWTSITSVFGGDFMRYFLWIN